MSIPSKWYRHPLTWLLIAGAIGYMALAGWRSYWADEIWSILDVRLGFHEMLTSRTDRGHLPVYYVILWIWRRAFGESEIALRLPSVMAVVVSAGVLYNLARRFSSRRVSLAVTALFLMSPIEIGTAPQARMYSLVQCLALVSTRAILVGWDRPSRTHLGVFAAVSLAGLNTHWSYGLVFVGQCLALILMTLLRKRGGVFFLAVAAGMLAVSIPWLALAAKTAGPLQNLNWLGAFKPGDLCALPVELLTSASFDRTLLNVLAALPIVACVAGSVRLLRWNSTEPHARDEAGRPLDVPPGRGALIAWMFVFPLAAGALFAAVTNINIIWTTRYFLSALPFFWLTLATVLNAMEERSKAVFAAILILGVAATGYAGVLAIAPWYTQCRRPAQWLAKHRQAHDLVAAVGNFDQLVPFVYYYNAPCICLPTTRVHSTDMLDRDYRVDFVSPRDFPTKVAGDTGVWLFLTEQAAAALTGNPETLPDDLRPLKTWMMQRSRRDGPPVGDGQLIHLSFPAASSLQD